MRRLSVFILSLNILVSLDGQNLVPNPSFEEYSGCPNLTITDTNIDSALFWSTPTYSANYFHPCATHFWYSVPENNIGYQYARTGVAYAGIFTYHNPAVSPPEFAEAGHEYIDCELTDAMTADSVYMVSMFVSLGDKSDHACACMEVLLTDEALSLNIPPPEIANGQTDLIEASPQLTTPTGLILKDTANWMGLCWLYQADGNEKHITIGNFKKHIDTEATYLYPTVNEPNIAYYYLDDVSIEKVPYNQVNINLGEDKIVCQPNISVTLTAHGSYYAGWHWNTGDTTQSIVATQPGLYWVEASNGMCHLRDTIEIVYIDTAALSLGPDVQACPQDFPLTITGPAHMETYQWSNGSSADSIVITGPGEYVLESTHACGFFSDTVKVEMAVMPIDLGLDTVLCGQPFFQRTLTAPPGYDSYLWSTGETSEGITVTTPSIYWVQASSQACGSFTDTMSIVNQPLLTLDLGPDTERCLGAGFTLDAGPGFDTYLWNNDATTPTVVVMDYGLYSVEASYLCGTLRDSILIAEPPLLSVQLPDDLTINLGESVLLHPVLSASSQIGFNWSPQTWLNCSNCETPLATPLETTIYQLTVNDENECTATDDIKITVENKRRVYIPNAFSPNGDGANDLFTVYTGPEVATVLTLKVFDRWGNEVYNEGNFVGNGLIGWDGKRDGMEYNSSVFVYFIEILYLNGSKEIFKGEVNLLN